MQEPSSPIVDEHGRIMFHCADCGAPLTSADLFELGLRVPDYGESKEDYCDAELVDVLQDANCVRARIAR
jgi:hypothetical protein